MKYSIILVVSLLVGGQSFAGTKLPGLISDTKVQEITCGGKITIQDHMGRMGFIIRSLREAVNEVIEGKSSADLKAVVMVDTQILRVHLAAVFPKTPKKIQNIDPQSMQSSKLIFQGYLLRLMGKTLDLEKQLLRTPKNELEEQSQQVKIAGLIIDMDETIDEAHKKFRF